MKKLLQIGALLTLPMLYSCKSAHYKMAYESEASLSEEWEGYVMPTAPIYGSVEGSKRSLWGRSASLDNGIQTLNAGQASLATQLGNEIHFDRSGAPGGGLTKITRGGDGLQSRAKGLNQLLQSTAQVGKPAFANANRATVHKQVAAQRMVIYQAKTQLHCTNPTQTAQVLMESVKARGGWMQSYSNNVLELRLPHEQLKPFLSGLGEHGVLVNTGLSAADVTEKFTDLKLHLDNAEKSRVRLQDLLTRQGKVEELLKVEAELKRVSGEVEEIKGKMAFLKHNSRFSKLRVQLLKRRFLAASVDALTPYAWMHSLERKPSDRTFVAGKKSSWGALDLKVPSELLVLRHNADQLVAISPKGMRLMARRLACEQDKEADFWQTLLQRHLKARSSIKAPKITRFQADGDRQGILFEQGEYRFFFIAGKSEVLVVECWGGTKDFSSEKLQQLIGESEISLNPWYQVD